MKRGFFAVGIYGSKFPDNVGTLWRSAHNFGADFIFTIGAKYNKHQTDTTKACRHVPMFSFANWEDFRLHVPKDAEVVFVEQAPRAHRLPNFVHPESAVYVLGAEDHGVPPSLIRGHRCVAIDTPMCLNVAVAGSILMYDRSAKNVT